MNNDPGLPFGFDTLTMDAVIVRGSEDSRPSRQIPAVAFGGEVLTLPAVLVPSGGTPPAGDWLDLGVARLPPRPRKAAPGAGGSRPDSAPGTDGPVPDGSRPETRFYRPRGVAPAVNTKSDLAVAGAAQWQQMNVVEAAVKRRQAAAPGVARKPRPTSALPAVDS